ncbi:Dps family protein [Aquimarina agarivorans]|uniref:Dps family protein n=1 Tax=Aquimarina agarivorans TaxID=980584 RepID=UPI000248ED41|nr:Dps family protein [Aquimarina agarivorans]
MNKLGLDQEQVEKMNLHLNDLLANYQIFYMNVRGFHWNIKGEKFFELHVKFEELYNDLLVKVDELAERILTLGGQPIHAYSIYLKTCDIKEAINYTNADDTVNSILSSFELLLKKQRGLLELSSAANDEGTSALMSDYIREQEKLTWMYSAFLG